MATARDVAKRADVSTSTVSHVLNGTRLVSDDLRQRVMAATHDLGYEPNAVARSLKTQRSDTVGLIISDLANPFFTAVVRGVEDTAKLRGYALILCNSNEDPDREEDYIGVLLSRQVDGLILAPVGEGHEHLARLQRRRFPLVLIDRDLPDFEVSTVTLDNERAAYQAVHHLVQLGHTRIGMISGRRGISTTRDRIAGYRRALEEAGLAYDDRLIAPGGSTTEGGATAAATLLGLPQPPSAMFAANNLMIIGALSAIEQVGLSVPADIALVGFDDSPWSNVFRPRLTTVAQPTYELGRTAAELLFETMGAVEPKPRRRVLLRGELIVRESCGIDLPRRQPAA